ncbi:hypothetical protein [Halegenticoccus tardaugens]|uniref:hypothetical protein n=1 Tax=Halegenticoccus tardaugens TaxID=2071624 RepID=UPI0013E934BE|nr:hypothetical protein [Halegenticoccus tardaugens]
MNFTNITDEEMLISNDTPSAESNLAKAYNVEGTSINKIQKEAGGLSDFTEGIN